MLILYASIEKMIDDDYTEVNTLNFIDNYAQFFANLIESSRWQNPCYNNKRLLGLAKNDL